MAELVPYPLMPPAPAYEQRRTTPGVETNVMRPEQQANLGEQRTLEADQVAASERARQYQDKQNAIDAEHARSADQVNQAFADEKARRDQELQADIGQWHNRLEGAYKQAKEAPAPRLFADPGTGGKALKALGLALAGWGDTIAAGVAARQGRAPGASAVTAIIEADLQRQRENIARLKDNVLMARTGVADAKEARRVALAEVDAKGAGFLKRLEAGVMAQKAALKAQGGGAVDQDKILSDIREKGLEYRQRSLAPLYEKHQGTTVEETTRTQAAPLAGPKTTESENKFALHGSAIDGALSTIEGLPPLSADELQRVQSQALASEAADSEAQGGLLGSAKVGAARFFGITPRSKVEGLSPDAQRVVQAWDVAVTNLSHTLTGAGMPEAEARKKSQTYAPVASDSPEVQVQKGRDMRQFARDVMALSGSAAAKLPAREAAPPPYVAPAKKPAAGDIPPAAPSLAPESPRDKAVRMLKANRSRPGAKAIQKAYNITDEDLR